MHFLARSKCRLLSKYIYSFVSTSVKSNDPIVNIFPRSGIHLQACAQQLNQMKCSFKSARDVNPYGSFQLHKSNVDLIIQPASPNDFPDMNKAILSVYSKESTQHFPCEFLYNDSSLTVDLKEAALPGQNVCLIEIPIKYDIHTSSEQNNSVVVQSMESDVIQIATVSGDITSKSVKADSIHLQSQSGDIACNKSIQGNINLQSESGNINGERFQGVNLKVQTTSGNISTQSVYSDVSHFSTQTGNINLKNLHRQSHVEIGGSGNLTISGMDGCLQANLANGAHVVQISQLQDNSRIIMHCGQLQLKVPEPCSFGIQIQAKSITLSEVMERNGTKINDGQSDVFMFGDKTQIFLEIHAKNCDVTVENQDWISSLGFRF